MPDKENKSNISKMPDRSQITSRLEKIRDYIQQTATIMDSLKSSGKPSHLAQYHKLAGMVEELQDSEVKLAALLKTVDRTNARMQEVDEKLGDEDNATGPAEGEAAGAVNSNLTNGSVEVNGVHENGVDCNDKPKENGAVLKTADGSRCNELRMRLEESQRKLQAMQEHQAALQALQQRTQEQLKEARAAQSTLMARTAAAAAAAATAPEGDEDQSSEGMQGNLESYRERLYALHEMYEHRDQDKLQELQTKKERMDHLVAEFQSISNGPGLPVSQPSNREKGSAESSKDGSDAEEDGNMSDIECDVQRVRHKMAQLSAMRAQLKRLQNLVDSGLQDTEGFGQDLASGQQEEQTLRLDENETADEEQAVNLRRQRQGKGRSVSRTNSTSSTATKPDNISQASIGTVQEAEMAIDKKSQKLRDAKLKLLQLQKLLATVMDLKSRGEPVPDCYLQLLEEETFRADQEEPDARAQEGASAMVPLMNGCGSSQESQEVTLDMVQAMAQEIRTQTQYLQEEKERLIRARQEIGNLRDLPFREKKTNTQMLLQAKRRELEELMRKDQGQSSAVNQDICSELSAGKSETPGFSYIGESTSAATWGGSTQGTLDDLGERDDDVQEQSAGYTSDEGRDEEEARQQYIGSQLKHLQMNATASTNNNANNNNNNNNAATNNKECLTQSQATNREALQMSLESGLGGGSVHSNAASVTGAYQPAQSLSGASQQRSGPRNVWRKSSTDSSATLPRAVWTPSQHPNTVDDVAANISNTAANANHNENESNNSNITQLNQAPSSSSLQSNWWQQQAMQLQGQLDATNNLYQSLLMEQQQQVPCWPQPPALPQMPGLRAPLQAMPTVPAMPGDMFYQQLLAATQFQQQQLLLTTLNQCCHLLWMQQREMATLRGIVMSAAGTPWLQQGAGTGPAPGLLSAHAPSASPVPALNNQVPPGNRANNYWDNFRSYSRQNLLSTSTKSNEGVSHSPSPLVDRSHNTLRNPAQLGPQPGPSAQPPFPLPEQGLPLNLSRKEKLNIERYHAVSDNYALPSGTVPDVSELQYHPPLTNNQYQHNANMQGDTQQGARALPVSVSNNTSSADARVPGTWHGRSGPRSFRGPRGANSKRKNPRLVLPVTAAPADAPLSSSSLASTPQDRNTSKHREALCHRTGRSLFDVLSESVYTEVAALIAVNEARPHFLIQLFRDLQMVSSDPLRQRTLQSIHELVSRYMAEASGSRDGAHIHPNVKACKSKEPIGNDSLVSSDDEENTKMVAAPPPLSCPSVLSPPRNAAWNANEEMTLPSMLPHGQNEWELEAVLEDLLPFLRSHLEELCTPALLDAVRQQAVQLMLAQTQSHCRHVVPGGAQHQPAGGYFQGQLDALLEDGLNKFQGCRLRDVCEDLLMVITEILQSELTFLKLVDTVRREDESSEDACKNPQTSEEPVNSVHTLQLGLESGGFPVEPGCQNRLESVGSAEGYNGDLAEADQSHHEETAGAMSPQQMEGDVAGAVVPEDSDDDGLLEVMQNEMQRPDEKPDGLPIVLSREDCEEQAKTEAEDEWAVEQDREQGLDRVPTRLTDELENQDQPAGSSANPPDVSSNP